MSDGRPWLIAAGMMSIVASALHVGCIIGGGPWYRFFGAGEQMAQAAERGALFPAIITACIVTVIAVWALYAFSAAGLLPRLPLIKWALIAIVFVLLARASAGLTPGLWRPDLSLDFKLWSSAICFVIGACFAIGAWQAWPQISQRM